MSSFSIPNTSSRPYVVCVEVNPNMNSFIFIIHSPFSFLLSFFFHLVFCFSFFSFFFFFFLLRLFFLCSLSFASVSPWYNHTGWLGVKHQVNYLLLCFFFWEWVSCEKGGFILDTQYQVRNAPISMHSLFIIIFFKLLKIICSTSFFFFPPHVHWIVPLLFKELKPWVIGRRKKRRREKEKERGRLLH